ncbi:GFA family protein [Halioglobus maricola]|uniref:GFA family protein n=1 Tax=Halioglobus maricola TaxID=2601894 RepID=A0A5P9NJR0_9GAMM|nr:GFA family protein [Halioglobus maricola]
MIYRGSCHCQAVRFQVEAPESVEVERCNCSICRKAGFLHLIVPLSRFQLLAGEEAITTYTFNTGVARHTFCKICGVKPFYTPRSNPDGIDINVNCLDELPPELSIVDFDGQNWEENAHALAHKSMDE